MAGGTTTARTGTAGRTAALVLVGLVRVVGVLLLGVSVVYGWRASWARFGVCFGGAEPAVDLPEPRRASACVYVQGDLYDQYMPEVPWVPIGDAARLEGLSLMALGLGLALVAASLAGRWFVWLLSAVGGVGIGAVWVAIAIPVWRTALAGERVGYEEYMSAVFLTWGTPAVTVGLAVLAWQWGGRDGRLIAVFWAAMTLAQPLPEAFITLFLWPSHDTSPLHGIFRCVLVGLAALVALVLLLPPAWRDRFVARPLRWVRSGMSRAAAKVQAWDARVSLRPRR